MELKKKNIEFLNKAAEEAAKSDFVNKNNHKFRVGCVAVYKGIIISKGYNKLKTHPLQMKYNTEGIVTYNNQTSFLNRIHAEVDCLRKIQNEDIDWKHVSLYIYRGIAISPFYGLARPCKGCMKFIRSLGIKHIYYTGDGSMIHEEIIY